MTQLIPQIPSSVAEALLPSWHWPALRILTLAMSSGIPKPSRSPTGGLPITDLHLKQLREPIVTSARKYGFPGSRPSSFLNFELEVAETLAQWSPL